MSYLEAAILAFSMASGLRPPSPADTSPNVLVIVLVLVLIIDFPATHMTVGDNGPTYLPNAHGSRPLSLADTMVFDHYGERHSTTARELHG